MSSEIRGGAVQPTACGSRPATGLEVRARLLEPANRTLGTRARTAADNRLGTVAEYTVKAASEGSRADAEDVAEDTAEDIAEGVAWGRAKVISEDAAGGAAEAVALGAALGAVWDVALGAALDVDGW